MIRAGSVSLTVFLAALLFCPDRSGAAVDGATQLYIDTVEAMQALPQPPFVSYILVTNNEEGLQVTLDVYNHDVWLSFRPGNANSTWAVVHRSGDFASAVSDDNGHRYITDRAFFDPTWYSAYHAMREGMFFDSPDAAQPEQRPIETAPPSPAPVAGIPTIATVISNATLYSVRDAGATKCPNSDAGRLLLFTPRGSRMQYQMSAAVVDLVNHLFCEIAFALPSLDGTPLVDHQYYGERGGYWVRTGGRFIRFTRVTISNETPYVPNEPGDASIEAPNMRSSYVQTSTLSYRLTDMEFPTFMPPKVFVAAPSQ